MGKKGLVISGGGAFGAYGAGTLAALNKDYDIVAGVSTGSLMGGLVALKKWDTLKEGYTSVGRKDIFDTKWYKPNVFKKDGKLNLFSVVYTFLTRLFSSKTITLGTTKAMRKTIDKFVSYEDYRMLQELNKDVIVAAVNINEQPSRVHYFNIQSCEFEDFKDWMWASANAPFVTSLLKKQWKDDNGVLHNGEWVDGGLTELFSLDKVAEMGCVEIDIIIHRVKPKYVPERSETSDFVHLVERGVEAMRYDIELSDGKLNKKLTELAEKGIKIRVYWLGRKLANNSLVFDKKQMLQWYEEGYSTINDPERTDFYNF